MAKSHPSGPAWGDRVAGTAPGPRLAPRLAAGARVRVLDRIGSPSETRPCSLKAARDRQHQQKRHHEYLLLFNVVATTPVDYPFLPSLVFLYRGAQRVSCSISPAPSLPLGAHIGAESATPPLHTLYPSDGQRNPRNISTDTYCASPRRSRIDSIVPYARLTFLIIFSRSTCFLPGSFAVRQLSISWLCSFINHPYIHDTTLTPP